MGYSKIKVILILEMALYLTDVTVVILSSVTMDLVIDVCSFIEEGINKYFRLEFLCYQMY